MTYTTTASTEPFLCSRLHVSAVGFNGFTYTWREKRTAGSGSVDSRNFCNDKKAPAFSFASIFFLLLRARWSGSRPEISILHDCKTRAEVCILNQI
jgi:hypothetical protein